MGTRLDISVNDMEAKETTHGNLTVGENEVPLPDPVTLIWAHEM